VQRWKWGRYNRRGNAAYLPGSHGTTAAGHNRIYAPGLSLIAGDHHLSYVNRNRPEPRRPKSLTSCGQVFRAGSITENLQVING
jgi:hypothetical protein